MAGIDVHDSSPGEIYAAIEGMDEESFDELMEDPAARERVIDAMIDHMVGLFRPEKAEGVEAIIHIKLWDRPEGGYEHFEMAIADGTCTLREPTDEPDLTLKVRPATCASWSRARPAPSGSPSRAGCGQSATSASA